jgi:glycosyltransferase involved in cell wall biosynthesis
VKLHQGGVVRVILDLCTVLATRGNAMSLAVYEDKDLQTQWLQPAPGRPHAMVVPMPRPPLKLLSPTAMRMIDQALSTVDVLHLHGPWLDGNRQIANLAVRRGIPYVVSLHGMLDDWAMSQRGMKKRAYMLLAGRRILDRAARIHCTASGELAQARKWFSNPNTVVLPCLVDLSPFENLPGPELAMSHLPPIKPDQHKLLFLSRLHEQKGVELLLYAARLLAQQSFQFVLLLAGSGTPVYEKFLHRLVDELKLQDRVIFLGHLNGARKLSTFQWADLLVHPTRHENFGLVLIEAMACGVPVLTTRGTDIWQEIQTAGVEISDANPASLAVHITRLLSNPADLVSRTHRARAWVQSHLATDSLSERYEQLYRSVVQSASKIKMPQASR